MKQSEQQLLDEISLREASLADARRELEAGELTALQAATIEARESLALARVRQELRRGPRRRQLLVRQGVDALFPALDDLPELPDVGRPHEPAAHADDRDVRAHCFVHEIDSSYVP